MQVGSGPWRAAPAPCRGGLYRDELLEVSGIGEKKAVDFGKAVLEQIDEFEFRAR